MKYLVFIVICIMLMQPFISLAYGGSDNERDFFSFEKYEHTYLYFYNFQHLDLKASGAAAKRIKLLAEKFVSGFDALKNGRVDEAILRFQESLSALPEYFHVDFILALAYEEKGDIESAARSYKSYLEKLNKFQMGLYRFTAPVIENTVSFDISSYENARELISRRMARHGIDMRNVSSGRRFPRVIIIIFIFCVGAGLYLSTKIDLVKSIIYKIKTKLNRSKDSWICLHCGTENININFICRKCGKHNDKDNTDRHPIKSKDKF